MERELAAAPSVLWAETPTNPLLRVADLGGLAKAAAAAGAPMIVDNTAVTGLLQRPLDWGAAASLYSLTKAISGHSDVIAGAVVSRDESSSPTCAPGGPAAAASPDRSRRGWRCAG